MHRVYGLVMFVAGVGCLLVGGYLLYTEYLASLFNWQDMLFAGGACLFGYLLIMAGYRMSTGERF